MATPYAFDANQRFVANGNDGLSNALIAAGIAPNYIRTRSQGFTGGAQIGYNFELGGSIFGGSLLGGGLVAGVEADAAYARLHGETDDLSAGTVTTARTSVDFVGTARGRLGLACQNILVYGTGGFAYGGVNDSVIATAPGIRLAYGGRSDRIRTGYAYGGGVEFAIPTSSFLNVFKSSAVTLKAEFIHYDLGPASAVIGGAGALAAVAFYSQKSHSWCHLGPHPKRSTMKKSQPPRETGQVGLRLIPGMGSHQSCARYKCITINQDAARHSALVLAAVLGSRLSGRCARSCAQPIFADVSKCELGRYPSRAYWPAAGSVDTALS